MCTHQNIDSKSAAGSILVVALVVLVILSILGYAALDVADMNILVSSNLRDAKNSFFHADSGANLGHEFLEVSIETANSTFYGGDATTWQGELITDFDSMLFPLQFYLNGSRGTYIRSGILDSGAMEGSAIQMAAGYEGVGKSAAHGGTFVEFLIRSHREGQFNSRAEVDMGWRHVNY